MITRVNKRKLWREEEKSFIDEELKIVLSSVALIYNFIVAKFSSRNVVISLIKFQFVLFCAK